MKTLFWLIVGGVIGWQCNNCENGRRDLSHITVYGDKGEQLIPTPSSSHKSHNGTDL